MSDAVPGGLPRLAAEASPARVCNWLLGGKDNFLADRVVVRQILEAMPDAHTQAATNRHFVLRAVRHAAEQGVRQFLDLGCGLPTLLDVHSIARSVIPDARVAYVDNDPLVILHSQATNVRQAGIVALHGDIRHPEKILADPDLTVIDFSEPVMVLFAAVLHFVGLSEDAAAIVAAFTSRMVPGSYLAISHAVTDGSDPAVLAAVTAAYRRAMPFTARPAADIAAMFTGFELIPPGLATITGQGLRQSTDLRGLQTLGVVGRRVPG
jgi:hypothetical protein